MTPDHPSRRPDTLTLHWALTAVLLAVGVGIVVFVTPVEATMGPVQKIFYLHLPAAINTFLACTVCFVASVGYLWRRRLEHDRLAAAAAWAAVAQCSVVLITGMIWGRAAWGVLWTWSPRLTFSLVLWLLYVVYLVVRPSVESTQRRAMVCALYAVVAFVDVPLVYLSVRLMPDIHPTQVLLEPAMKYTLLYALVPLTLTNVGLIAWRYRRLGGRAGRAPLAGVPAAAALSRSEAP